MSFFVRSQDINTSLAGTPLSYNTAVQDQTAINTDGMLTPVASMNGVAPLIANQQSISNQPGPLTAAAINANYEAEKKKHHHRILFYVVLAAAALYIWKNR